MWPKTIYQKPLPPKKNKIKNKIKNYQANQRLNEQRISQHLKVLVKRRIQYHVQKGCKSVVIAEALDTRNQVV